MLFTLVDRLVAKIAALDVKASLDAFAQYTLTQYPGIQSAGGTTPVANTRTFCELALGAIKLMPAIIGALRKTADDPRTSPGLRMTILSSLAYLVQERDLIPDDAPAGYGLIDDCALLLAATREINRRGERSAKLEDQAVLGIAMVSMCLPPERRTVLQEAVNGITALAGIVEQLPPEILAASIEAIIENPLAVPQGTGAAPPSSTQLPDAQAQVLSRRFPGGGYLNAEGDSVSVGFPTGGGATMVGKDIVVW